MVTTRLLQKHSANMEENSVPKRNELQSVVELYKHKLKQHPVEHYPQQTRGMEMDSWSIKR